MGLKAVPKLTIDLKEFPEQDRLPVFRDYVAGVFDINPLPGHEQDFDVRGSAYALGTAVLSEWQHSPIHIAGDRRSSALQSEEIFVLSKNVHGSQAGTIDDVHFEKKQLQLVAYDLEAKISTETTASHVQEFALPYSEVGYVPSVNSRFLHLDQNSPVSRIVDANFDLLMEIIPESTPLEAVQLSKGFGSLLKGVLADSFHDDTVRDHFARAREAAIRRFVRQEIKNPNLTADRVCKEIGLSRAALFRIFKPDGGFKRAITKLRLNGALAELARTSPAHGAIQRVARNWVFPDQAHFSRLFKESFGFRPTDAVGVGLSNSYEGAKASFLSIRSKTAERRRLVDLFSFDPNKSIACMTTSLGSKSE